ncbi:MAG: hypothetical protein ACTSWR_06730 [Candidatus Helarchaeota archaeon]
MSVTKKSKEDKLRILKSIVDSRPFGFTLLEIFKNFQNEHMIGSRNTLKKYLEELVDLGEIKKKNVGRYTLYLSKDNLSPSKIFEEYPGLKNFIFNLFTSISNVFKDEIKTKGKLIGMEFFKFNKSQVFKNGFDEKNLKRFREKFKILSLPQILENIKLRPLMGLKVEVEVIEENTKYYLIYKNSEILQKGAWILYYIQIGFLESFLNVIFDQKISVNIESIDFSKCVIKIERINSGEKIS